MIKAALRVQDSTNLLSLIQYAVDKKVHFLLKDGDEKALTNT